MTFKSQFTHYFTHLPLNPHTDFSAEVFWELPGGNLIPRHVRGQIGTVAHKKGTSASCPFSSVLKKEERSAVLLGSVLGVVLFIFIINNQKLEVNNKLANKLVPYYSGRCRDVKAWEKMGGGVENS